MCAVTGQRREAAWFQVRVSPLFRDPSVWTCMTNDYLIDDGLTTSEPQACADLSLGGSIRSDITPTNDGGGLGDDGGGESAYGADDTFHPWMEQKHDSQDSQSSYAPSRSAVLPLSHRQVRVMMATISLSRKNALPLARRTTRPSRG